MQFVERTGDIDLRDDANNPIIRAVGWSQTFQASTNPYQRIASSSATNPIVITLLDPQASFADNVNVMIGGHSNEPANSTDSNPSWTVASSSANTFAITGAAGIDGVTGNGTGYVCEVVDATNWTPYIILLPSPDSTSPLGIFTTVASSSIPNPLLDIFSFGSAVTLGTFTWIAQTALRYSISLTHTQSAALYTSAYAQSGGQPTKNPAYGISLFIDANNETRRMGVFTVPIVNATSQWRRKGIING